MNVSMSPNLIWECVYCLALLMPLVGSPSEGGMEQVEFFRSGPMNHSLFVECKREYQPQVFNWLDNLIASIQTIHLHRVGISILFYPWFREWKNRARQVQTRSSLTHHAIDCLWLTKKLVIHRFGICLSSRIKLSFVSTPLNDFADQIKRRSLKWNELHRYLAFVFATIACSQSTDALSQLGCQSFGNRQMSLVSASLTNNKNIFAFPCSSFVSFASSLNVPISNADGVLVVITRLLCSPLQRVLGIRPGHEYCRTVWSPIAYPNVDWSAPHSKSQHPPPHPKTKSSELTCSGCWARPQLQQWSQSELAWAQTLLRRVIVCREWLQ